MHNLKITTRLAISIIFLLGGLAFLLYAYFSVQFTQLESMKREKAGIAFLKVATQTSQAATGYRNLLVRVLAGAKVPETVLRAAKGNADAAYARLGKAYEQYGEELQLRPGDLEARRRGGLEFAQVEKAWKRISVDAPEQADRQGIFQIYSTFIALSQHVGEVSGLVVDEDLPSFSLVDASTNHLNHAISRFQGQPGSIYHALYNNLPFSEEQKMVAWDLAKYIVDYNIVKVRRLIENSLYYDTIFAAEKPYQQATKESFEHYEKAGAEISAAMLDALIKDIRPPISRSEQLIRDYQDATFDLWYKVADQLSARLELRIATKEYELSRAMTIAGLCVIFALGFFVYITQDIIRSLKTLEDSMDKIAEGELAMRIPYQEYKDEIGHMARTLERFRRSYWWLNDV